MLAVKIPRCNVQYFQSSLAISEQSIVRQPPPFQSACAEQWPSAVSAIVSNRTSYQTRLCHLACTVQRAAQKCGCESQVKIAANSIDLCTGGLAILH